MALTLEGEFSQLRPADIGVSSADVAWDRAQLALGIAERPRDSGTGERRLERHARRRSCRARATCAEAPSGIHAPVAVNGGATTFTFSLPLSLNGSLAAYFVPAAADTTVEMTSNFPHPNFQGNWLPVRRSVTDTGFSAAWAVPFLGRNYPQAWTSGRPRCARRSRSRASASSSPIRSISTAWPIAA